MSERQVPALFKAKIDTTDEVAVKLTPGKKTGYMILSEFENDMEFVVTKVYPRESTAKASADGQQIIKVDVLRVFE
jgi:hypothetical protein